MFMNPDYVLIPRGQPGFQGAGSKARPFPWQRSHAGGAESKPKTSCEDEGLAFP